MASKDEILEKSVVQLAADLRSGKLKAVDVMKAYKARAVEINDACNAVLQWCDDAEERAKEADEYLQRTGRVLGPFHGVPCTIKDHFQLKGTTSTLNTVTLKRRNILHKKDDGIVAAIRNLGAIPFAKTIMTQYGETGGSGGPADGDCLNPWDTLRTPQGSSSGEGALIAGGASPFGLGSDIGGSVRGPSANCGISTLKPTVGRIQSDLVRMPGDYSIVGTSGIMARTASDCAAIYSAILSETFFGANKVPRVPPIPFDHVTFSSKAPLKVGYFIEEVSYPKPCPTARRAVEEAVEALRRRGHEVVPFFPESNGALDVPYMRGCDLAFDVSKWLLPRDEKPPDTKKPKDNGPWAPTLPAWTDADEPSHPDWAYMRSRLLPEEFATKISEFVQLLFRSKGTSKGWTDLLARRDRIRQRFYDKMHAEGLDVLLCPTLPLPAVHVEDSRYIQRANQYCRLFNFMDMPAGHVTTTLVTAQDLSMPYDPCCDAEAARVAHRCLQDGGLGLPMGVQIAALPWREELCLRAMCEVQEACPFFFCGTKLTPVPRRTKEMGGVPEPIVKSKL